MTDYVTISGQAEAEFIERKSRFIGCCRHVETEAEALAFLEEKRKEHWDATHNVFAYILREGQQKRCSDDGEPQGTAGVPVLDVLQKAGVTDLCMVVTRYFGGILGSGGEKTYDRLPAFAPADGLQSLRQGELHPPQV